MRAIKPQSSPSSLSARSETLLRELAEECRRVLKLLAQLETSTSTTAQREAVLGELSAAILHLHEHTRGLASVIERDA